MLPLAGLTIPDTGSLACETAFPNYSITGEVTISAGCYRVAQAIVVEQFGSLSLAPGVVLKFAENTELVVNALGALQIQGLPERPVVLTGERSVPGWWRGVTINRSDDERNVISHAVIEYTGGDSTAAGILLNSSTNAPARLRVENSLIRFSDTVGVSIPGLDSRLTSFRGNLITRNENAIFVNHTALASIDDGSDFIDNDQQFVFVPLGNYVSDIVIDDPGLPIQLSGLNQLTNTLVINEGVEMIFTDNSFFRARGNLAIRGTPENPVLLSSKNASPGNWQGLQLIEGANVELSNVIIENGGRSSDLNSEGSNLFANRARLSAENLTLRNSSSFGFYTTGDGVTVDRAERINSVNNARDDIVRLIAE